MTAAGDTRILGLDLGSRCGWALTEQESGVWELNPRRGEDSGMRLVKFRAALQDVIAAGRTQLVAYEEVLHLRGVAEVIFGELGGVMKLVCKDHDVRYVGVNASTLKKFATGKGNSRKDAMVRLANERWGSGGRRITDDNEADALWVREWAWRSYGATLEPMPPRASAIEAVRGRAIPRRLAALQAARSA